MNIYHVTFNDTLAYQDKEYSVKAESLDEVYDKLKEVTHPNSIQIKIKIVKMKDIVEI